MVSIDSVAPSRTAVKRGRPQSIDPVKIIRTATGLMSQQGYAGTTMTQIADASGISQKSLFLYFPTKADLFWPDIDMYVAGIRGDLDAAADTHTDPLETVIDAVLASISRAPSAPAILKMKIRLINTEPELQEAGEIRSLAWRHVIADYLHGRYTTSRAMAEAIAYGFWTAMWDAFHTWAHTELPTPLPTERDEFERFVADIRGLTRQSSTP